MGTMVTVVPPTAGGTKKTVSTGGIRYEKLIGEFTMGATYATGGDTLPLPVVPGGTLRCVSILYYERVAGMSLHWDGSTSTPKIKAFDEDNASGIEAELANASSALAAVEVIVEYVFRIGA